MKIIKELFFKIKNRYGGLYLSIVSIFILLDLIASLYISSFVYEPNTSNLLYMFFTLFVPSSSIIVGIITIIKFVLEALKKKEGSHLKLAMVSIMAFMTVITSLVISKMSYYIIESNLNLFTNKSINDSLSYIIEVSNDDIINKQNSILNSISNVSINYLNNIDLSDTAKISNIIYRDNIFTNIIFVSNSYYGYSTILFNSQNYVPLDINYRFSLDKITFANSEYNGLFYINAIVPLRDVNHYAIIFDSMPSNYINVRNNALNAFRIYNSINMFTGEFSIVLKLLYVFILGISTFISIIFGIIFSSFITRPISLLLNATNSIINSDFNIEMKFSGVHDLRNLIYRFNVMARALKYHRDKEKIRVSLETWKEAAIKVAHEIKNPLMPIMMNAELIEKRLKNNMSDDDLDKISKYVNTIIKNSNSILSLVKSFSEFSFNIKLSDEKESINDVLIEVFDSFKNMQNVKFQTSFSKIDCFINMDRDKLLIAFRNLIKNAIEAMDNNNKESLIYLSSYHEVLDGEEFFTVSVTDTGNGIEKKDLRRIFEPYFTSKDKGTGIGLAIVEKIISEHNGRIDVDSIIGEGTTFFIRFEV
ncbi:sensor histidine kinase [Brachyspira pilosicoli]|uniref:sensor histidine kinase n=1 Tax=Brachyspira pilosicoli TaxID=52584 RepID=UPI001CA56C9A|nr:ATP-binding protein [Brachyspira pilosicoli]MBW5392715.1 GHKL domain-containing protein [Brachyspira pilosicoli]WIH85086.1 ATP-binding protein [Brachyspira pilosicoli]